MEHRLSSYTKVKKSQRQKQELDKAVGQKVVIMYARVVTVQTQQDKIDEMISIYKESIIPAVNTQRGFRAAFLLTDPGTNKGISITLWETEAAMTASETSPYLREQLTKVVPTLAGSPNLEYFEVSAQVEG